MAPAPLELAPVGYVRNAIREGADLPFNGAPSTLELLPEYAEAALGLNSGEYVWVLAWLDRSERGWVTESFSHGPDTGRRKGCFSSRTPRRLNPVSITVARILAVEAGTIRVDGLDLIDGTPLLDIKPYVREFDCVFAPADPAWRREVSPEERLERLVRTVERFCGALSVRAALGCRIALAVDRDLAPANDPLLRWRCACDPGAAGALQAVSGRALGDERFVLLPDEGWVEVQHAERGVMRLSFSPAPLDGTPVAVLAAPEAALFTVER